MINQSHFRTKYKISYKPPPKNVEEFIRSQNWDSWPRDFIFSDKEQWLNDLKKLKEDCTFAEIYSHLWSTVPRVYDASINMETRLEECSTIMKKHASKIFEGADLDISTFALEKFLRYKSFLKKYKQKKIMISSEMETKKNIEGSDFSGFKASEITPLPRHLDAERIYLFILKAHNLDAKVFKIWKSYILSPSSITLLIDSFWWWFLHKFKPDRENQAFLFDRMSESYAMLFMSIPINRKDAFIKVYPDCLSQAIYATFQEAFPESCELFDEEFIEELGNTVFLWLSGLKPPKHFWTHWKVHDLSMRTIHGVNKVTSKSVLEKIAKNKQQISTSIYANVKMLKDPKLYGKPAFQDEEKVSRHTKESHPVGLGPELNRFLLNTGGQSPLILYYLKMHNIAGVSKTSHHTKITLSEIYKEPPPFPTYHDALKEAKKQLTKNQRDFHRISHKINEEIKFLRQRQKKIDKEIYRLQGKALKQPAETLTEFENFLYSLQCPTSQIESDFFASLSSSSSVKEDYNLEELQKKSELKQ